jgi:hypothetical protein
MKYSPNKSSKNGKFPAPGIAQTIEIKQTFKWPQNCYVIGASDVTAAGFDSVSPKKSRQPARVSADEAILKQG